MAICREVVGSGNERIYRNGGIERLDEHERAILSIRRRSVSAVALFKRCHGRVTMTNEGEKKMLPMVIW